MRIQVTENYWKKKIEYLEEFLQDNANREASSRLEVPQGLPSRRMHYRGSRIRKEAVSRIHGAWARIRPFYK